MMDTIKATSLRKDLFGILARITRTGEPLGISRLGKPAAATQKSNRKPLVDPTAIADFCRRHRIDRLSLFGSILRPDFNEGSDVDVLVDLQPRKFDYHEHCMMIRELEAMFGRKVDLLTESNLKAQTRLPRLLKEINATRKVIYDKSA